VSAPTTLLVGGGGFLGTAIRAVLTEHGHRVVVPSVPWSDPQAAGDVLRDALLGVQSSDGPWNLVWCAGTGVVATDASAFVAESVVLDRVFGGAPTPSTPGSAFFASSAGAVFAGSEAPPFDEATEPHPLAPYGRSRLAAEERFTAWAAATGTRLLIGRIANLYGPGANLRKRQGLVSQLALAHVEGRPSSIYVPFETTRDYLYIDDAAAMVAAGLDAVAPAAPGTTTTKIFASQAARTISEVVDAVSAAFGEPIDVRAGHDPSSTFHGTDLRFRSTVLTGVDDRALMPFDEGVRRTVDAVRANHHTAPGAP
jgi:UDP-glucose 4-epimerase